MYKDTTRPLSFDVPSGEALVTVRDYNGPVLVDLDETLYLRNSTEDFIDTACPASFAFALLKLLELISPWRWTGGLVTRDAWRVRIICLLMPWTILLWRQRVVILASKWTNQPLLQSLHDNRAFTRNVPTIVTLGFTQLVKPLISEFGLGEVNVVAMSPWKLDERCQGKLVSVTKVIGEDQVRNSLLITDSLDDHDILEQCARPLRVIWPSASFVDAFSDKYIPGQYLAKIKRPGQQYMYRVIVREDFVFWLLCSLSLAPNPFIHVIGLALLMLSFWVIYEWGYMDNDQVAQDYEDNPHLSEEFHVKPVKFSTPLAWVWASISGILGLLVLRSPEMPSMGDLLSWAGVLLITYYCYLLFNRLDKLTRIWPYAFLRLVRIAGFVVIVPVPIIGAVGLCAYTISRWIPYMNYRAIEGNWNEKRMYTTWLLCFCIICIMLGYALGWQILWSPTAFALLSWNIFKARFELKDIIRSAHLINRLD